jgi:hypothetical protein
MGPVSLKSTFWNTVLWLREHVSKLISILYQKRHSNMLIVEFRSHEGDETRGKRNKAAGVFFNKGWRPRRITQSPKALLCNILVID